MNLLRWATLPLLPVALVINRSREQRSLAATDRLIRQRQQELLGEATAR